MSVVPNTYNGLVSALKTHVEDPSTEFDEFVPLAIHLAEERLAKSLDSIRMRQVVDVTATPTNHLLTKPTDTRYVDEIYYTNLSSERVYVEYKNKGYLVDYWPSVSTMDAPKYFSDWNADYWTLAPTPDSNYVFTVTYGHQVSALSSVVQTNYYTDFCSDALFYAARANAAEFLKDYETVGIYDGKFKEAVQTINNEGRRQRRTDDSNPRNPVGGRNTMTGDV